MLPLQVVHTVFLVPNVTYPLEYQPAILDNSVLIPVADMLYMYMNEPSVFAIVYL